LRTLFLVGVVVAIILGSALSGLGAAPSWVGLVSTRTEPAPAGEPGEPGLAAMAKGKRDQKSKSKGGKHDTGKGAKKHQANGNKHGKGTSAKHKGQAQRQDAGQGQAPQGPVQGDEARHE